MRGVEQRRQRQFLLLGQHLGRLAGGQVVDLHDLHGEIVRTALLERRSDDPPRRSVEVAGAGRDRLDDGARRDVLVDAVGRQHQHVTRGELHRLVVDLDAGLHAECAAEIGLLRGDDDAVVLGELLQRAAGHPIDAAVADMEDVGRARLDDERAQRADIALVLVVVVGVWPRRVWACSQELVASMTRCAEVFTDHEFGRAVVVESGSS